MQGRFGDSVRRKLRRRIAKRSMINFNALVALRGPGDICLDLGANLGEFTQKFAATGAEVHGYEPDPHCFAALQARFAGKPNVHLYNQAVSGAAGNFLLRRSKDFAKSPDMKSQSSSIVIKDTKIFDSENSVMVETVAFGDVVRDLGRPVALVKMDIEGAEFSILDIILAEQAKGVVLPIGAMFIETHERFLPERVAMIKALRTANWDGELPYPIDTFWA